MAEETKKILIVEDDEDLLSILQRKFSDAGFAVIVAKDGEEGFNVAVKEKPAAVITDILMPKIDGIAMVKKIKETLTSHPVFIFLTNVKDQEYTQKAKGAVEASYLIKSDLHMDEVVNTVKKQISAK